MEKQRAAILSDKTSKSRALRILYIVLGFITFGLGCVGIVVVALPTVPFFLLTSYFFAKGSKRFNDWFVGTKLYKNYVSSFAEHRVMSIGYELTLMIFVSAMLAISCYLVNSLVMSIVFPMVEAAKYCYFILRIKTVSKQELMEIKNKKRVPPVEDV